MGNREDLLAGAKYCLIEKGYARTTARDIRAASGGVSMAAIGYHFGSKEALLNAALSEASGEWGAELGRALAASGPGAGPVERFEAVWTQVIGSLAVHRRLWVATFEVIGQLDHVPGLRDQLAAGLEQARLGLAELIAGLGAEDPGARRLGSFYQALLTGVMAQHLIDPEHAPSGHDLAEALRMIAAGPPDG